MSERRLHDEGVEEKEEASSRAQTGNKEVQGPPQESAEKRKGLANGMTEAKMRAAKEGSEVVGTYSYRMRITHIAVNGTS